MNWLCFNGDFIPDNVPSLSSDDKSFRYGDGIFETMKFKDGRILLSDLHFERLFSSLQKLHYTLPANFTRTNIEKNIFELVEKNGVSNLARVRLTISRGNGHIKKFPDKLNFLIESTDLSEDSNLLNQEGLTIDVFEDGRKSMDRFSNIKSSSMLLYSMASRHANQKGLDDCLVLNTQGRITDSSIANIFLIRNNLIITPALSEGAVDGVMRRHVLKHLSALIQDVEVREGVVTKSDLDVFDEIFLTNAIQGIRWVKSYKGRSYQSVMVKKIYDMLSLV